MSETWTEVAKLDDVNPDTNMLRVDAFDEAICIYVLESGVYATQDLCTHGQACLSEGWLEDETIECPLHQGVFDIKTGAPIAPPVTEPLTVYETQVKDKTIFLRPKAE